MVYIIFLKVVTMQCTTLSVERKCVIPPPRTVITVITLLNIYQHLNFYNLQPEVIVLCITFHIAKISH